jgi:hypothetical protein
MTTHAERTAAALAAYEAAEGVWVDAVVNGLPSGRLSRTVDRLARAWAELDSTKPEKEQVA